jgi:hypothetical protein
MDFSASESHGANIKGPSNSSSADFRGLEKIPNLKKLHLGGIGTRTSLNFQMSLGNVGHFSNWKSWSYIILSI